MVSSCPVCGEDGHGRLTVRGEDVNVSVAWAGRWGVVAIADCRLGIDAELLRGAPSPVTSALAPQEVAALDGLSGRAHAESFLRLWTAKEAVAKADGRGLTLPLAQLDAAPVILHGRATVAVDGTSWHAVVWDYEFPDGERAAFAIATEVESLSIVWSPKGHERHLKRGPSTIRRDPRAWSAVWLRPGSAGPDARARGHLAGRPGGTREQELAPAHPGADHHHPIADHRLVDQHRPLGR